MPPRSIGREGDGSYDDVQPMTALRLIVGTLLRVSVYGLLLFLPARSLHWWRAWVLLAIVFVAMIVARLWIFAGDSGLLEERRMAPIQRGQPWADKVVVVAFVIVMPAYIAFIPLDVFRLHLLGITGVWVSALGLVAFIAGYGIIALALRENAFAAAIVKHQSERGQTVVETGVYNVVRHPLYAGVALVLVGAALWLESNAAAVAAVIPLAVLIARILVEEQFLRSQLAGYDAYARRVKFRVLPGLW